MRTAALALAGLCLAAPALAGDAAMRALEATIQQQANVQQQQREQQMRQQQEQMRQREAMQPALITGPDGAPVEADGARSEKRPAGQ
jgi:hypothetical protein